MEEDQSGSTLEQLATSAGHSVTDRQLVKDDIYAIRSTASQWIQSRAIAGIANGTLIFSLPGSSNAVETAWQQILKNQLDIDFKPCNFAELIPRFREQLSN